jgi:hypothetical protein
MLKIGLTVAGAVVVTSAVAAILIYKSMPSFEDLEIDGSFERD